MSFTYPTNEKLKSQKHIDLLFSEGKSVSKYPLRLVFAPVVLENDEKIKIGVSVSKKHFKNAVNRNHYKRLLRECYRLNKKMLVDYLEKPYAIMFFYQSKETMSFKEMNEKTVKLFEKFIAEIKK
ncbi:ribonuclease P protein component [Flavobacterium orientale]|uniref:Ribonuclease P protein component n=1 Tax=Flavobacterium orientale TaxID=1756020 RepID=A0A917DB26_9FLAO|nr:ribonuclease P protein component [Flavobacterium orientale]GGD22066.1 ribonuclease P protein component [Flavobacterium orientale]